MTTSRTSRPAALPALLFDTCALINISLHKPVFDLFAQRFKGRVGWPKAVSAELARLNSQDLTFTWVTSMLLEGWMPDPIPIVGRADQLAVAAIQREIAGGAPFTPLEHLGEAAAIFLLYEAGGGTLVTDDLMARQVARREEYNIRAVSTVAIVADLMRRRPPVVTEKLADDYLNALRRADRLHQQLSSAHLLSNNLGVFT